MTINPQDSCQRITSPTGAIGRTYRHGQGIPLGDMYRPGGGADGLLAVKGAAQTSRATGHSECSGRSSCAAWSSCLTLMRPATTDSTRSGRLQRQAAACPAGPCGSARDRSRKLYPTAGGEEPNYDAISERQHS
jgi:hypothetical protein